MDSIVWMLTGGAVGWAGYSFLGLNEERGMKVSIVIGAVGALVGGKMIAPIFTAAGAVAGDFGASGLIAAAVAAGFLAFGNLAYHRWHV